MVTIVMNPSRVSFHASSVDDKASLRMALENLADKVNLEKLNPQQMGLLVAAEMADNGCADVAFEMGA